MLTSFNAADREDPLTRTICSIMDITKSRRAERELFWQNRELTAFHRISEVMLSGQSTQSIFDTIARETSGMTDFPMVAIELCDFERAVMVYRGAHGIPLHEMPTPFEVPMDVSLSGQVAHTGELLVEHNVSDRREYAAPILRMLGVQTFVCVPIKSDGQVVGTLSLSHQRTNSSGAARRQGRRQPGQLSRHAVRPVAGARSRAAAARRNCPRVYDRVPSVLCLFDEQLQIVRANLAATEFAGRISAEAMPARMRIGEFFHCQTCAKKASGCGQHAACSGCDLPPRAAGNPHHRPKPAPGQDDQNHRPQRPDRPRSCCSSPPNASSWTARSAC